MKIYIWDYAYIYNRQRISFFKKNIENIENKKIQKVLDLGCGDKPFKNFFDKKVEYIGIDISKESRADIILDLNTQKIPFPDEFFDLVIASEIIEHIYNQDFFFKEMIRVVKKGGYIYISTPFMFPQHDPFRDYYRYTELFYKEKLPSIGINISDIEPSNTIISTCLVFYNLIIRGLSLPKFLKYPFHIFNNFLSLLAEKILDSKILANKKIIDKIKRAPIGILVFGQKFT
jgi:SAM-dependent methyltransferase